ncbi:MAG: hypothetical protein QXT45_06240 [Candidatus Bilamarchaeaceae archaeon]
MKFDSSRFVEIGFGVMFTLIVGSYAFTWGISKDEQQEKQQWRDRHEARLEKKFDEINQNQKELTEAVYKSKEDMKELLLEILREQRKRSNKGGKQNE